MIVTAASVGENLDVREHDAVIYDASDTDNPYKFYFSVRLNSGDKELWCVFSDDGETWGAPQQVTIPRESEDPSILTHLSGSQRGHAYRIGGKLIMYVEDHATSTVYGYESSDGLTFTELSGNPVIPLGSASAWDDTLVGSPVARWDGTNVIVGYEGRASAGPTTDSFGIAHGTTPNSLSKLAANPLLKYADSVSGVGQSVVVDAFDLNDAEDLIVLIGHDGLPTAGTGGFRLYATELDPLAWVTGDFTGFTPPQFHDTRGDLTFDNSSSGMRVVGHPESRAAIYSYPVATKSDA